MEIILWIIIIFLFSIFITHLFLKPTENVWYPCTYCKACDKIYSQSGLNASVYTCPNCGKNTLIGYSFKVFNNKTIVQER